MIRERDAVESQVTNKTCGHILTNTGVWSPDSRWLVYDTRSDPAGEKFDGSTIEIVHVDTGEVREIYRSHSGAHCGVATFSPVKRRVVFILGPENPTLDWQYSACHRRGVLVEIDRPQIATSLDACDIVPPFTPGALRGGSHVHVFDGNGDWVSFTYEDHILAALQSAGRSAAFDINQRNVGVSIPGRGVTVPHDELRNHSGSTFSVLATRTVNDPRPGSDEISRACEEGWVGTNGYLRGDGSRQKRAIAFQGTVLTAEEKPIVEVFVADLPDYITQAGDGPLQGTATTRPMPPRGAEQRRLTYTAQRKFPGLQGPRHWLRSSPDGSRIAQLMRDDAGVVQIWTISPLGGAPELLTQNPFDVSSAFTWSPSGNAIAYVADNSIFTTDLDSGATTRHTPKTDDATAPRPEACVFSPDGTRIAYVRHVPVNGATFNQIFAVALQR